MSKTGAVFSVRFLKNGDNVVVTRNIINKNGDGAALFQAVDTISGAVKPDWKVEENQPIIQLGVRSSVGYPAEIMGVTWAYNGTTLNFTLNGSEWVQASNDSRFKARINGQYYEMMIVDNLASKTEVANKQIAYEVSYRCNAMTDTVQGSADVLIQVAGSDSHILQITTNRVELDTENTSATLKAVGMYGTESITIGSNGYTIKWFQDGTELTDKTTNTLIVDRDMVTGGSIFVAKLYLNGNAVAQDAQRISDIADEYQVKYVPTDAGSNYLSENHNASYTLSLLKNGQSYGNSVTFSWNILNEIGKETFKGEGSVVTLRPEYALVEYEGGNYHSDCNVLVTAEF